MRRIEIARLCPAKRKLFCFSLLAIMAFLNAGTIAAQTVKQETKAEKKNQNSRVWASKKTFSVPDQSPTINPKPTGPGKGTVRGSGQGSVSNGLAQSPNPASLPNSRNSLGNSPTTGVQTNGKGLTARSQSKPPSFPAGYRRPGQTSSQADSDPGRTPVSNPNSMPIHGQDRNQNGMTEQMKSGEKVGGGAGDGADKDEAGEGEEGESDEDEENEVEENEEPWRLFNQRRPNHSFVIQGWVAQGFTWNPSRPADGTNGLLGMNDRSNDYLLNQVGLSLERPLSDESGDRRLGFRMDTLFGGDARFVQSRGFDDQWTTGGYFSLAMPQLYADWHMPDANPFGDGMTLRVGRFWSPIGYEGVSSMDRYFYSVTNAFMLAQPSTHTGALLQMPLGSQWTAQAGVVQGWDVWKDNNNSLGGLGTLGWTSEDEATTVTHVLYFGDQTDDLNDNQLTYELIATRQLTERLNYVGWFDFNFAEEIALDRFGNSDKAQWFSLNQAWIYSINEKWSAGTRFEWLHDDDGVRIKSPVTQNLLGKGELFGLTLGTNYTPNRNWIFRPEIRWDWAGGVVPYDDQTSQNQFTAAMDLILLF